MRRRYSALEVLFDILKYHGSSFSPQFWLRVFDSVLLPIFDHVRAEVTDTTTFTDDKRRAEVDSWLYDTCTRTLQHIVDIVVQYYAAVSGGWAVGAWDRGGRWGVRRRGGVFLP
jgi:brefeldin A-inhibited guanine nucleotide-exchange protein